MKYDGCLLHQRFAYRYFREQVSPLGNLLIFRGPMEVLAEGMLDQEDLLNQAFIDSDDALNFVWELPILGNNPFAAVAYQRLFNTLIAEILSQRFLSLPITMRGDDIMVHYQDAHGSPQQGKCSVSITHVVSQAALGHTGINIYAGSKAPPFAYSTELTDAQIENFANAVSQLFQQLNQDMFVASAKVLNK